MLKSLTARLEITGGDALWSYLLHRDVNEKTGRQILCFAPWVIIVRKGVGAKRLESKVNDTTIQRTLFGVPWVYIGYCVL
jgi:hypothetical protein